MRTSRTRWAALTAAVALGLAGCSGVGSSDDAGSDGATISEDSARSNGSAAGGEMSSEDMAATEESDDTEPSDPAVDGDGSHLARSASLTTTVEDVERASARVRSVAEASGGYIAREEGLLSPADAEEEHSWAEIVVTVPEEELSSTITALARIGDVTSRSTEVQDLSRQYTDTESRVRTLTKSVARLQTLIEDAADLEEIVALESELTRREADLESMTSQQKALEQRTTTAPITVTLQSPETAADDADGFVAGLATGWAAFVAALGVGLTVLGVVTPFAVVGLLLTSPLLWWLRRRRATTA